MMDPILAEFEALVAKVRLASPAIPFVATLTGEWADGAVARPVLLERAAASTVRFADGLRTLTADGRVGAEPVLLEVGPGRTLTTFADADSPRGGTGAAPPTSLPAPDEHAHGYRSRAGRARSALGERGEVDWRGFHSTERRRRVGLPTYPFQRRSYWIGPSPDAAADQKVRDTAEWFYRPVWREAPLPGGDVTALVGNRVMVFDEATGLGAAVVASLRAAGALPLVVTRSERFERAGRRRLHNRSGRPRRFCATRRRSLRNGAAPRGGRGLLDRRAARRHRTRRTPRSSRYSRRCGSRTR